MDRSPFFDIHPVIDVIVGGYIRSISFTLTIAVEKHLGVYNRLREDYADIPLHPSYAALQTLYRVDRTPDPVPATNLPSLAPIPESEDESLYHGEDDKENTLLKVNSKNVASCMSPQPSGLEARNSEASSDPHPQGWEAIPRPKGHSGLDYSRWDRVEDDSSEEEEDEGEEQQPQYRFRVRNVGVRPVK